MKPINVCMVVNSLDVGGLEKVVIDLTKELESERFRMHLVCCDGQGALFDQLELPASRTLVLTKDHPIDFVVAKLALQLVQPIRRFLQQNEIDVLHAHNLTPLLYAGTAARLIRNRPRIVYSEHNQIYRATPSGRKRFWVCANLADEIVAVSHDLKRTLKDEVKVLPEVNVIHNGIDGERFSDVSGQAIRAEFGIADDEFVVGTAVVHSEQKGLGYMLEAAKIVTDADPKVRFVLAGNGPMHEEIVARSNALGLGDKVIFPGYRNDVPELISAYNVYALSSLWEGLPLALLEALAIGRPIVATTVGGNPEVVNDGENGFLVPPKDPQSLADRLLRLRRNPELEQQIRERNRQRFEADFSLHHMVDNHAQMFTRLAADKG